MTVRGRQVYVRRSTRMTAAQHNGYALLDDFRLVDTYQPSNSFDRRAPTLVEIGFGMGSVLIELAKTHSEWNCVGVDVYRPGIGALLNACVKEKLDNIKVVEGEGLTFLENLADGTVDMLLVLFPDPWPKKRHHKRRMINTEFANVVATKLKPGVALHVATDWQEYADVIQFVLDENEHLQGGRVERPDFRPVTKFEKRGIGLGHEVWDFRYERTH